MPITDSVPERRNLVLLSLSIIVFYLAGGQLSDQVIRLQIVNVTFANPAVLAWGVWVLLFWFCYRYWLVLQDSWRADYIRELTHPSNDFIYYNYLVKKFELGNDFTSSPLPGKNKHAVSIRSDNNKLFFEHQFQHVNQAGSYTGTKSKQKPVSSFGDQWRIFLCRMYIFFRKPTLSTYFTPYILFLIAVSLGLYHSIF